MRDSLFDYPAIPMGIVAGVLLDPAVALGLFGTGVGVAVPECPAGSAAAAALPA